MRTKRHLAKDCPNKDKAKDEAKLWRRQGPKEGELETKTVDGNTYKWCLRCCWWMTGKKMHRTAEHKTRKQLKEEKDQQLTG